MKRLYKNTSELIKNNLDTPETNEASELILELKNVKQKGFFDKNQFYKVVMWKSPRPKNHYLSNPKELIIKISRKLVNNRIYFMASK